MAQRADEDTVSTFDPGESNAKPFYARTYVVVRERTGIDPIAEGRQVRDRIRRLLEDDLPGLRDADRRERVLGRANRLAVRHGERMARFWTVYFRYCFTLGQMRAAEAMLPFVEDGPDEQDRLKAKRERILDEA